MCHMRQKTNRVLPIAEKAEKAKRVRRFKNRVLEYVNFGRNANCLGQSSALDHTSTQVPSHLRGLRVAHPGRGAPDPAREQQAAPA